LSFGARWFVEIDSFKNCEEAAMKLNRDIRSLTDWDRSRNRQHFRSDERQRLVVWFEVHI
jgi:hypothetical protein